MDCELPPYAPNKERHLRSTAPYSCWALYTTAEVNDSQQKQLQDDLNSVDNLAVGCKLAPKCSFHGGTLRDVYDYHLQLRDQDLSYHALWFIVADSADYKKDGVQIVSLNSGRHDEDNKVDVGRCGVDMACLWLVNFDIANQDWMDLKEEEFTRWGGQNPYPPASNQPLGTAPRKYHWYGTTRKAAGVAAALDPEGAKASRGEHKFTGFGGFDRYPDPLNEIAKMHLRRCKAAKNAFHPTLFVWVDQENIETRDQVTIVRLQWSGDIDSTSMDALSEIVPDVEVLTKVAAGRAWEVLETINHHDVQAANLR